MQEYQQKHAQHCYEGFTVRDTMWFSIHRRTARVRLALRPRRAIAQPTGCLLTVNVNRLILIRSLDCGMMSLPLSIGVYRCLPKPGHTGYTSIRERMQEMNA